MAKIILLYACPIPKSHAFFSRSAMPGIAYPLKAKQRLALNIKIRIAWRLQFFLLLLKVRIQGIYFLIKNWISDKGPFLHSWSNVIQMPDYNSIPPADNGKDQPPNIAGTGSRMAKTLRKASVRGKIISFDD